MCQAMFLILTHADLILFDTYLFYHQFPSTLQAQMTLKHAQAELKTKQAEMKKMDGGYKKDQETLQAIKKSREKLEAELAKLNYEGNICVCVSWMRCFFLLNIVLL